MGLPGPAGESPVITALQPGGPDCPQGGAQVRLGQTTVFVCNGAAGPQGLQGAAGESVVLTALAPGDANCPFGGSQLSAGGVTSHACNGAPEPALIQRSAGGFADGDAVSAFCNQGEQLISGGCECDDLTGGCGMFSGYPNLAGGAFVCRAMAGDPATVLTAHAVCRSSGGNQSP